MSTLFGYLLDPLFGGIVFGAIAIAYIRFSLRVAKDQKESVEENERKIKGS